MGSGSTRKTNDEVIINRPKKADGTGNGGGGAQSQENMNTVCKPTFRVKLDSQGSLPAGSPLQLRDNGEVLAAGRKVGMLSRSQLSMVTRCQQEGFRYAGRVVDDRNVQYGVFTRE